MLRILRYFLLVLTFIVSQIFATTHWIVSEEGRIESQEKRVDLLESLKDDMYRTSPDHVHMTEALSMGGTNVENLLFSTDPDCQEAGRPLAEFDLFIGTVLHRDIQNTVINESLLEDIFDYSVTEPKCEVDTEVVSLGPLDSLTGMLRSQDLKVLPEYGLDMEILQHGRFTLNQYGNILSQLLQDDPNNWLYCHLASNYWRIIGNSHEAISCLRKSTFYAPLDEKHYGFLVLANLFHRAHRHEDAIAVLEEALQHSKDNPTIHFSLGNVYATVMEFDKAESHYEKCLDVYPTFREARYRHHAVKCHKKIESSLLERQQRLEQSLAELRRYKKNYEQFSSLATEIITAQASIDTILTARMVYEQHKIKVSKDGRGQNCVQHQNINNVPYVTCDFRTEVMEKNSFLIDESGESEGFMDKTELDVLLQAFESKMNSLGLKDPVRDDSESEPDGHTNHQNGQDDPFLPTLTPKYQEWPRPSELLDKIEGKDFPCQDECSEQFSDPPLWNEYPTVFLSPENKGFNLKKLMSRAIEFPDDHPAPLPWYPPFCSPYEGVINKYDQLKTIEGRNQISSRNPEKEIEFDYDIHSPERNFHEWGARVTAALKLNLAPQWIVYLLAGTYWRIWGHSQNGIQCYRHALARAPPQYRDVVLTNFAGLLYKTGAIDDALVMARDAQEIDDKDPYTNFFLANLYSAKGNMSGAIHHYKQALRMKHDFEEALKYLYVPTCHIKFYAKKESLKNTCMGKDFTAECLNSNSLSGIEGMDSMILCHDGHCQMVSAEEYGDVENPVLGLMVDQHDTVDISKMASKNERENIAKKKTKRSKNKGKIKKEKEIRHPHEQTKKQPVQPKTDFERPSEQVNGVLPVGVVEIGTVAEIQPEDEELNSELEPDIDVSSDAFSREFIGPIQLIDDALPDVMLRVHEKLASPAPTPSECADRKEVDWDRFTSTWLSVSAKGIDIREYMGNSLDMKQKMIPYCPEVPVSSSTMDHLEGIKKRKHLYLGPESGLKEAFLTLTFEEGLTMEGMATKIAQSLSDNSTSWVLSTAAALFRRVRGNAHEAVNCLRHSLFHAPREMSDIPLISMSNIMHKAGLYNDALILTNKALEISPKFVVIHFTMGNIYASKGEMQNANSFYLSSLALQSTFDPARNRLLAIQCDPKFIP